MKNFIISKHCVEPCPEGHHWENGRDSVNDELISYGYCIPCNPGFNSSGGYSLCLPCPQGTYANVSGSSVCIPCDSNHYCPSGKIISF